MLRFAVVLALIVIAERTFADEPEAIVGGMIAAPGEFPYQCSLNKNGYHTCGCSIINEAQVLTAAHCLEKVGRPPYNNLRIVTRTVYSYVGNVHQIKTIRMHPKYSPKNEDSWVNDIAVITLAKTIKFDKYQYAVPLATTPPVKGTTCVMSGWGRTKTNGPASNRLLKMYTALFDRNSCSRWLNKTLYDTHVCAFRKSGIGACQGDSGGPLVCNGKQVGVTSFVLPCALGVPDVYTDVYYHREFIRLALIDTFEILN